MKNPFSFGYHKEINTNPNYTLHGLTVCRQPGEKYAVMLKYFSLNDAPCRFSVSTERNIWSVEKSFLFDLVPGTIPGNCIMITAKRFNNIHPAK